MTAINKSSSYSDEKSWNSDSFVGGSSLYKISSTYVSHGTVDGSLDHDYDNTDGFLVSGSTYEIHLTSDTTNHGWSSNNESTYIEFDLFDQKIAIRTETPFKMASHWHLIQMIKLQHVQLVL